MRNESLGLHCLLVKMFITRFIFPDFDRVIKRPVASKYAEGLFNQLQRADGKMFNVSLKLELTGLLD